MLPPIKDLKTMDYANMGSPYVELPTLNTINLESMDYAYLGQPFVRNYRDFVIQIQGCII